MVKTWYALWHAFWVWLKTIFCTAIDLISYCISAIIIIIIINKYDDLDGATIMLSSWCSRTKQTVILYRSKSIRHDTSQPSSLVFNLHPVNNTVSFSSTVAMQCVVYHIILYTMLTKLRLQNYLYCVVCGIILYSLTMSTIKCICDSPNTYEWQRTKTAEVKKIFLVRAWKLYATNTNTSYIHN